jgi:dipeptidyl aminopeptidase/acylaminoacyl peptidase
MTTGYIVLGRPDWTRPRLAPTGDRLAAIRWHDGAANVWVGSGKAPMQLATDLRPWRLREFHWGADGRGLVLALDDAGGHRHGLAWLDLRSRAVTRLTPDLSGQARSAGQIGGTKPRILISVRHPSTRTSVLQAVTTTGEVVAEWPGPGEPVSSWLASDTQAIAVCITGSTCTWWRGLLADHSWSRVTAFPAVDAQASRPLAFGSDSESVFATSSAGRDTIALVRMSAPAWTPEVLSVSERFDITSVLISPDGSPDIVTTTDPDHPQSALTSGAAADLSRLRHLAGDTPARIIDRNASHCLAEVSYPVGGPAYVIFSRTTKAVSKPLVKYTGLSRVRIHSREPFTYAARDGRLVTGFITRPPGPPPWPVVLAVHDGPWARDEPKMDPWAQYLASAGFCCVQVNYRGSRGFGKAFRDAGDGQWSLAMQDDLVDALTSPPVTGVADPHRISVVGHGYGGYAALMLTTQSQVPVACAVAASAPVDLVRYTNSLMSLGGGRGIAYAARIGHPVADHDKLTRASPSARVADLGAPLLLFHGRQDACVPVSHLTAFAESLRRAGKKHDLIIYEDEGRVYSRPQNVADFRLRTVEFLLSSLAEPTADGQAASGQPSPGRSAVTR